MNLKIKNEIWEGGAPKPKQNLTENGVWYIDSVLISVVTVYYFLSYLVSLDETRVNMGFMCGGS